MAPKNTLMDFLFKQLTPSLEKWRTSGALHIVYALAVEALIIGYLYFAGFFTIETLLPTFVTTRFSLAKFLLILTLSTFATALLGRSLNLSFSWNITKKSPLLWLGIFWAVGILSVSLIKFPPLLIPVFIAGFFLSGYLFWNIFFEKEK